MHIINLKPKLLSVISVLAASIIFAKQDIWISELLQNIDPLLFTFWIFLIVALTGTLISFLKKKSFKIPKNSLPNLLGLNFTTFISWIFTFLALSKGSPAVVAAGTLSAPLLICIVAFDYKTRITKNNIILLFLIFIGLILGALQENINLNFSVLIYCLIGSLGVVGNSFFMKRLHNFNFDGNVLLSYRFIMLILFLSSYFLYKSGTIPYLPLNFNTLLILALLTSYIPLFILYYAHKHLEIFFINLLLALTPVFSLVILSLSKNSIPLTYFHILSVVFVLTGVIIGYLQESIYEKRKNTNC